MGTWEDYMALKPIPQAERFLEVAAQVVAEAGEGYVYPRKMIEGILSCRYVWEGEPDCLIARILVRLGVSIDTLSCLEGHPAGSVIVQTHGGGSLVGMVADAMQCEQDGGSAWAHALHEGRHIFDQRKHEYA